jgi:Holliday junction resolvase RusA-like endonuclease
MKFSLDNVRVERRPLVAGEPVVVQMPFPPSVNSMFNQANGQQRFPTKAYKDWKTETEWKLLANKPGRVPGPVRLLFEVEEKDRRQRDITNHLKAPEDMLVKLGVIDGDHSAVVRLVEAKWSKEVSGVRITITPHREAA